MTTNTKKAVARRPTIIGREFRVDTIRFLIATRVEKPRGNTPVIDAGAWMDLSGHLDEPIQASTEIGLAIHAEADWKPGPIPPPSIGGIIQLRPNVKAVVSIPVQEFNLSWSLATSGHLKYCHFACTEPKRHHAAIVSVTFSSRSDAEAE